MERDFTDVIRNKSQFEESAGRKISDTRQHDSYISDANLTTDSALQSGKTISEKLQDYKYEVQQEARQTEDVGGYKTETELHNTEPTSMKVVDASGKEEMVSSNLFDPAPTSGVAASARSKSYMSMMMNPSVRSSGNAHGRKSEVLPNKGTDYSPIREQLKTSGKYSGETAYDTATGKYAAGRSPEFRSYTFKGNQVQGAAENVTGKYSKAYATYVNARKQTGKTSVEIPMKSVGRHASKAITASEKGHMHFDGIAGKGSPKATDRLKSYKMSDGQGVARPNGIRDTKVIRSSIASKAKGTAETKSKLAGKTKGDDREIFKKKMSSEDTRSGKYKSKAGTGKKGSSKGKIVSKSYVATTYAVSRNSDGNSGVEAAGGTLRGTGASARMAGNATSRLRPGKASKYTKKSAGTKYGSKIAQTRPPKKPPMTETTDMKKFMRKLDAKNARKIKFSKGKAQKFEQAALEVKQIATKVAHKLQEIAARNASLIIMVAGAVIAFIAVSAALSSCAMALTGGTSEYVGGLAGSEDIDLTESDSYFTEKEMLLQEKIDKIEEDYPDYDEYIYDVDEIGHDALKLMAFLSAEYETYDLSKIQGLLDEMFDEMYTLTLEPKTEIRTRMVTKTGYNEDGTTYEYEEEEEYEWKMLYVTLEKKDWDSIIEPRFTDDKNKEMYEIYDDTDGAHQAFYNPFEQDWSSKVTSEFGWRIHPISGKEKFHNGIDIGLPTGTQIHACATGKVIQSYYSESAGNYIVIEDETGYTTHYMHLSVRSVSVGDVVKHGDIIGEVGSTGNSTGPHLHLGVKNAGGEWLNPRFMVSSFYKE